MRNLEKVFEENSKKLKKVLPEQEFKLNINDFLALKVGADVSIFDGLKDNKLFECIKPTCKKIIELIGYLQGEDGAEEIGDILLYGYALQEELMMVATVPEKRNKYSLFKPYFPIKKYNEKSANLALLASSEINTMSIELVKKLKEIENSEEVISFIITHFGIFSLMLREYAFNY